jgi:hypothetical protein
MKGLTLHSLALALMAAGFGGYFAKRTLRSTQSKHWFYVLPLIGGGASIWMYRGPLSAFDAAAGSVFGISILLALALAITLSRRLPSVSPWTRKDWLIPLTSSVIFLVVIMLLT